MTPLSQAQKIVLASISVGGERRIAWQTAISLRRMGLIRGRFAVRPAALTDPTQWVVTESGAEALKGEAKP